MGERGGEKKEKKKKKKHSFCLRAIEMSEKKKEKIKKYKVITQHKNKGNILNQFHNATSFNLQVRFSNNKNLRSLILFRQIKFKSKKIFQI